MPVLLTLLSVLAVWALLTVLALGLLLILKALQGIRRSMEKITMGVRAIEKQAEPLEASTETLIERFEEGTEAIGGSAEGLRTAARTFQRVEPLLRSR